MSLRAVVVACALGAAGGCSLVVSTNGLAGDQDEVDAGSGTGPDAMGSGDAAADAPPAFAGDSGGDVRVDADAHEAGVLWPGNGHRYEVRVYSTRKSWTEARDDAATTGGHLVTITSVEEDSFVSSLLLDRAELFTDGFGPWIGAFQPNPGGSNEPAGGWAWVTGEPWSYQRWAPGEPNDSGGDEHYAQCFNDGSSIRWNDNDVSGSNVVRSAVIEYE